MNLGTGYWLDNSVYFLNRMNLGTDHLIFDGGGGGGGGGGRIQKNIGQALRT